MHVVEFSFTAYQHERSRDSNSQLKHIEFKDGLLSFVDEWRGYHPRGGSGRDLSTDYVLSDAQLTTLVTYLQTHGLTEAQEVSPSPAGGPPGRRRSSRAYGRTFTLTTDAGTVTVQFGYKTSGPRVAEHEAHPLNQTLEALETFLKGLRSAATLKEKTAEEREAERFFNRYGYRKGETPTTVSGLVFYSRYEPIKKRYAHDRGTTPFLFQHGGGEEFFVVYRESGSASRRVTYTAAPAFFEELAALLVEHGLHEEPPSTYYSNDGVAIGEHLVVRDFHVTFNRNSNWRFKYELKHYDTPENWARYEADDSFPAHFRRFEAGLRALLDSPHLTVIKER